MISILQLGTIDYATGLRLQERLVDLRKEGRIGDALLLLEHSPVITLGRNAKANNIVAAPELLTQRGVAGQLVAYPIFDLRGFPSRRANRNTMGVIEFVRNLEEVLIRTCAKFGIPTKRIPGLTGVWTGEDARRSKDHVGTAVLGRPVERSSTQPESHHDSTQEAKIAALGVHISRGVTSHGIALNVNTDLSFFDLIVPCGITSKPVTSIANELDHEIPMQDVAHVLARNFSQVFSSQVLWLDSLEALLGNNLGVPMSPPEDLRKLRSEDDTTFA